MTEPDLHQYEVELPQGGRIPLHSAEEVEVWTSLSDHYIADFQFTKGSDLASLSTILSSQIEVFRAQQRVNGMQVRFTEAGVPTGDYERVFLKPAERAAAVEQLRKASADVRDHEKALGIDKKSRDASGANTIQDYLTTAKQAAHEYGVHITERVKFIEAMAMEVKTKIRILDNADDEDRGYHNIAPDTIIDYMRNQLVEMERLDQVWAKEKGILFRGKL